MGKHVEDNPPDWSRGARDKRETVFAFQAPPFAETGKQDAATRADLSASRGKPILHSDTGTCLPRASFSCDEDKAEKFSKVASYLGPAKQHKAAP